MKHANLAPLAWTIQRADEKIERALLVLLSTATPKEYRALVRTARSLIGTNCWWATKKAGDLVLARGASIRKRAKAPAIAKPPAPGGHGVK